MKKLTVMHTNLGDNYIYLLVVGQEACVIDPTAAEPVEMLLSQHHLTLKLILNTHHHFDHVGGNNTLHRSFGCPIIAGSNQIPNVNKYVQNGDLIPFADRQIKVIATPGHTRDSLCFYIAGQPGLLFTGDTLFIGGCGRVLGGSASQLWTSLNSLAQLPDDTLIYPGHEYTLENYAFSLHLEPDNQALLDHHQLFEHRLGNQGYAYPSTIAIEKQTNLMIQQKSAQDFIVLRQKKELF